MCIANDRLAEALSCAQRLVELDPTSLKHREFELQAYVFLGQFEDAEACFARLPEAAGDAGRARLQRRLDYFHEVRRDDPGLVYLWEQATHGKAMARAVAGHPAPLPVIQYWSQGEMPGDVQSVTVRWNALLAEIGLGPIAVFDRKTAQSWIANAAPEFLAAFQAAFHYALESDIFRLAYASRFACLYLDADKWPTDQTKVLLVEALSRNASLVYMRAALPNLSNGMFIARPGCPFFADVLAECRAVDLGQMPRSRETIVDSFGPGRFQSVFRRLCAADQSACSNARLLRRGLSEVTLRGAPLLIGSELGLASTKPPFPLAYKATEANWKRMQDPD